MDMKMEVGLLDVCINWLVDQQNIGDVVGGWSMFSQQLAFQSYWLLPLPRLLQVIADNIRTKYVRNYSS
jgi:hypothetical protein